VIQNLVKWFQDECDRLNVAGDIQQWEIITGEDLPPSIPKQTDGSSCGVFVGMTTFLLDHQTAPSYHLGLERILRSAVTQIHGLFSARSPQ